jgi:hypothetical protein
MAATTVHNLTAGFRGLNTEDGYLELAPGASAEGVTLNAAERKSAEATGYFKFGGAAPAADETADAGAADALPRNAPKLKKIAADEGIDVGSATKVDDLIAAIEAGRAAKAGGGIPPSTPPSDDLDKMADDDLRSTVAALTGKPVEEYANTERDELLKLARADNA